MNNYRVLSPVFAAHLNQLIARIARDAVFCPAVSCQTTYCVAGYDSTGAKTNPPGVGGLCFVGSNLAKIPAGNARLYIAPAPIPQQLPPPDQVRIEQNCVNVVSAQTPAVGGSVATVSVAPIYSTQGGMGVPVVLSFSADLASLPTNAYDQCGCWIEIKNAGDFGYEQDVLSFNAWLFCRGVIDYAPSNIV